MKLNLLAPLKNIIKKFFCKFLVWLSKRYIGSFIFNEISKNIWNQFKIVTYEGINYKFLAPNSLNIYRINTFESKEPETLEWLRSIPLNSVLWDVGANIGLYSIYAAMSRQSRVFAFEPSVFNLEILARNIILNGLQKNICIIPIALNDRLSFNMFKMSNTEWGGALSTFEYNINQDGGPLKQVFEYQTIGMSIDDVCSMLEIPLPEYLKIDVDGIEHLILRGGLKILHSVTSVLIEINDNFKQQSQESTIILQNAGFILHKKCYLGNQNQYNQWWIRANQIYY